MTRTIMLGDVVQINPTTSLKKDNLCRYVSMDKLNSFNKKITGYEKREFKDGAKFINSNVAIGNRYT